jgi:phospholipid/cholesterol/gamma-HCH transport system substrate-binding protein
MMRDKRQLELKVGLFLNLGLALVAIAIFVLGATQSFIAQKDAYLLFLHNAAGLQVGAKVLVAGIQAGSVESLDLSRSDGLVRVKIEVQRKYADAIRTDTTAELATEGLLGDKVIYINAGNPKNPVLPPGSRIRRGEAADLSKVVSKSDVLLSNLTRISKDLDSLVKSFVRGNREEVLASGLAESARNLASLTRKLDRNAEGDMIRLSSALKNLDRILGKIDHGAGSLGALINDPELYDDAKKLIGEANQNRIVRNLVRKTIKDSEERQQELAQESEEQSSRSSDQG